MEENILSYTAIKCKEHPLELITNFCINEKCMTGLCAQCVCVHTDAHMAEGSSPIYRPIKEVYNTAYGELSAWVKSLEDDKTRILAIMKETLDRKTNFKNVMQTAKNQVLRAVERIFEGMQKRFQQEVREEQRKTGLHSINQLEIMCRRINREITHLINQTKTLNSIKFLDIMKTTRANTITEAYKTHEQVSKHIQENEQFKSALQYNKSMLAEVEISIRRLVTISFAYPKTLVKKKSMELTNKQNILNQILSQQTTTVWPCLTVPSLKVSQFITPQQNLKNSVLFYDNKLQTPAKHERSSSINLTQRSNSVSAIKTIPQMMNTNSFPVQYDRFNQMKDFRMTGSRVFVQERR